MQIFCTHKHTHPKLACIYFITWKFKPSQKTSHGSPTYTTLPQTCKQLSWYTEISFPCKNIRLSTCLPAACMSVSPCEQHPQLKPLVRQCSCAPAATTDQSLTAVSTPANHHTPKPSGARERGHCSRLVSAWPGMLHTNKGFLLSHAVLPLQL